VPPPKRSEGLPPTPGEGVGGDLPILHVDMDAFFVAVEVQAEPSLAGLPVIVGGAGPRGVVASCSYEARAYGVRSAMPSARARQLCPQAVFLPGHYDAYAEASRRLHEVLGSFTPKVEGIALDEAFLDVSGGRRLFGPGPAIGWQVRREVRSQLGLVCSVGVGRSKLIAKLASKAAKPRPTPAGIVPGQGVVAVPVEEELAFLHPLPVRALWGVGPASATRLARMGVQTVGDLAAVPPATLVAIFGKAVGRQLHDLAWARDSRTVEPNREVKSIGHEETYPEDLADRTELERQLVRMADAVAARLRRADRAGRTVTIKVRFGNFSTITRSHTEAYPLAAGPAIAGAALRLLEAVATGAGVRLLGVSVSGLTPAGGEGPGRQLSLEGLGLDDGLGSGWGAASAAVDEVRARFGEDAVGPATLARGRKLEVKKMGDAQWGPAGRDEELAGPDPSGPPGPPGGPSGVPAPPDGCRPGDLPHA
jgi:DNA polymerase-4